MLIVALVLAVIGLASLVTAVVTGNELIAWVCIAASVLGVILLIIDAIRERQTRSVAADLAPATDSADEVAAAPATVDNTYENFDAEYPDEGTAAAAPVEDDGEVAAPAEVDVVDEDVAEPAAAPVDELDEVTETDGPTEVHHVSADDVEPMQVNYVSADESDTSIEYVTEADPAEDPESK